MIGIAKHLTRITSMDAGLAPPRHPNPLRASTDTVLPVVEVLNIICDKFNLMFLDRNVALIKSRIDTWPLISQSSDTELLS